MTWMTPLILVISFLIGYVGRIAYVQLRDLYRLYKMGKTIESQWSDDVLEILSGDDEP